MKKLCLLFIVLITFITPIVEADNYDMKELIPAGVTTTIRGDSLLYRSFQYQNGFIQFQEIKNNAKDKKSLSISIGLFDSNKKNIGTINHCVSTPQLESKESKTNYMIDVKGSYLEEGKTYEDIKYIAVLSENENCRTDGSKEFLGQTVEEIGMQKNTTITDSAEMLLKMIEVLVILGVALFLYRFLFTNAYRNMDGEDVRQEYSYINKQLRKEREKELKRNPPKPKEVKKIKSDKVLAQEQIEKEKENNQASDLHNLYK